MEVRTHQRPRDVYAPRVLLPGAYGSLPKFRKFGKDQRGSRGKESLPEEFAVLCPNRIREIRLAAGFENVTAFTRHIGSISYQRLIKIETGRVIVRESEYEILADALKVEVEDLKLPLLTQSETAEWNSRWGAKRRIEEGGDHDSVLLAAYVRKLVKNTGTARTALLKNAGYPNNCLSKIWYADLPIDRHPDSTMAIVIKLAKVESWDEVIMTSRRLYDDYQLQDEISEVQQPRVRYAPEDPDRRAPWTYEPDPFRTRKGRRQAATPLSATPRPENYKEQQKAQQQRLRQEKIREKEEYLQMVRRTCALVIDQAKSGDVEKMLHHFFPGEDPEAVAAFARKEDVARMLVARVALTRFAQDTIQKKEASAALGITIERLRQIKDRYSSGLFKAVPKIKAVKGYLQ